MTDEHITAYLLGELSDTESEQFEGQCFAYEDWPAELESAEDDLIDAYIREELTPERRNRFEEKYLTTVARKERVLIARSFLQLVCQPSEGKEAKKYDPKKSTLMESLRAFWNARSPVSQFAVAVLVLAAAVTAWLIVTPTPVRYAQVNLTISSMNRGPSAPVASVEVVKLPLDADALRILLKLPEPSPEGTAYRVLWENVNDVIGTFKIETQDGESLAVVIPAARLVKGQYLLKLFRTDRDGTEHRVNGGYFFNVE